MAEIMHRGGCLCGSIRFETTAKAENPHTCSCKMCQRHTGSLSAAWVEFPKSAVSWTGEGGPPSTYRSSAISSRAFCPACGSTIGAIDDQPTIALLVGCFDTTEHDDLIASSHSF
ncbi:GFA family protein [Falsiruegeria mediterranea]